jgi:hypothetical protein
MRRLILAAAASALIATPFCAHAQYGGSGGGGPGGGGMGGAGGRGNPDQSQQQDDAKKKKRDKEWGDSAAPLPALRNSGPCPFVKSLYDASRYVEFKDTKEASANVAYSGEIQGISAGCEYKDNEPIKVTMDILFELGKGPQANAASKTYHYWVAVTDRNREVIARQSFDLPVNFAGKDRVFMSDSVANIVIPRGSTTTSGANFEILVGFDVTPQMAEFNRQGKRFRVNAAPSAVASAGDTTTRR